MKSAKNHSAILLFIALVLFVVLFVFFVYAFLHEAGHALAGAFWGQSLMDFNISFWDLSAHVRMVGGDLTQAQLAVQAVAGAVLPLLIWALFIKMVPRKGGFTLEVLKLLSSMVVVNTLLAWIILPILFLIRKAPSDDVTNLLRYSQMPPLLLTFIALISYAGGWVLFLSKIDGLRNELLLFKDIDREKTIVGTPKAISVMTVMMAFCLLFVFGLSAAAKGNALHELAPSHDFARITQIDLSTRAYSNETLIQFTVDDTTYVGVFIVVRNINTQYFDLSVTGTDNYHSTILHGEGYNVLEDGGLWEQPLSPGTYQLVLTSHQSSGNASVYLRNP